MTLIHSDYNYCLISNLFLFFFSTVGQFYSSICSVTLCFIELINFLPSCNCLVIIFISHVLNSCVEDGLVLHRYVLNSCWVGWLGVVLIWAQTNLSTLDRIGRLWLRVGCLDDVER